MTGGREDLRFVSPRTGRAVSDEAAAPYRARLLPLPPFLAAMLAEPPGEPARVAPADVLAGLRLTGAFLARHVFGAAGKALPAARERMVERFARLDPTSCVI